MRTEDRINWSIPAGETGWQVAPLLFAKVRTNAYVAIPLGKEGQRAPTPMVIYRAEDSTRVIGGLAREFVALHWKTKNLREASNRVLLALVAYAAKTRLQAPPRPKEVVERMLPFPVKLSYSGGQRPEILEEICAPEWCIELLRCHGLGIVEYEDVPVLTEVLPYELRAVPMEKFDARSWDYAAIYNVPSPLIRALKEKKLGIRRPDRRKKR